MAENRSESLLGAQLQEVTVKFEGRTAIDNVSLTLTENRIGLIGLNGCGKSTLARLVCGLIKPDRGTVRVNDVDVASDRRAAIATVGMVFQNPDHQIIFPTVEEEIAFGPSNLGLGRNEARIAAQECLRSFGRENWQNRAVHTLSQGQRHLVTLLAAIVMKPSFLVLDEPFTGPDKPTVRQLLNHLGAYDGQVLLITHDHQFLNDFDRIIWLSGGRVVEDGSPSAVLPAFDAKLDQLGEFDAFSDIVD